MINTLKWPCWMMLSLGLIAGGMVGHFFWRPGSSTETDKASTVSHPASPTASIANAKTAAKRPDTLSSESEKGTKPPGPTLKEFQTSLEALPRQTNPFLDNQQSDYIKLIDQLDVKDLHAAVAVILHAQPPWARMMCLAALFKRLADADPESALREALAISPLNGRYGALSGVFQVWAKKDSVAVVRWLQSQPKDQSLDKLLQAAIPGLSENAPEAAFLLVQSVAPHLLRNLCYQLFYSWAKMDPVTALAKMMSLPSSRNYGGMLQGIISEWAQRDFPAAEAWVNSQPKGSPRTEAFRGLLGAIAATDPARAATMLMAMPDLQEQKTALYSILGPWSQNDITGAVAWMKQLPDGALKQAVIPQVVSAWAGTNPLEAADFVLSLPSGNQRNAAMSSLASTWANSDAKAAIAWIKNIPTSREQQIVLQSSIYSLAQSEPAATAALLDELPVSSVRRNCLGNLLQAWLDVDPNKALEWAQTLPSAIDRAQAYQQVAYSSWARQCPTQAVAVLMSLPPGQQRNSSLSSVISQWGYQDLQGALDWSLKLEDATLRKQTLRNLQGRWVEVNPLEAVTFAHDQTDWGHDGSLASSVSQWTRNDPVAAITWVAQLPATEVDQLLPSAIGAWAQNDPVEAAKYVSQLQPGKMQNEAAAQAVSQWAQQDPARAAKWAAGFGNEDLRTRSCRDVAGAWAQNDPDAAGAWVKELPAGKPHEAALQSLIYSLQYADPKSATQWAETVADPNQRNQMMESTARQWLESDPSAKTWIANSSLPEETKKRLLQSRQGQ